MQSNRSNTGNHPERSAKVTALIEELITAKRLPAPPMRRAIRQAAGVTQARLAQELNVSDRSIAGWEAGTTNPSPKHRRPYTELLHSLNELARK